MEPLLLPLEKTPWKAHSTYLGAPIWFISLSLLCCQSQEQPETSRQHKPIDPTVWTLQQQVRIYNHERPSWMNTDCNTEPCFKEVWSNPSTTHVAYWSDDAYHWSEKQQFKTRWRGLNGTLLVCLGHPYSVPVSLDPAGTRKYLETGLWELSLSGNNKCALSGTLYLSVNKERLNFKNLMAGGLPWAEGGLEQAQALLLSRESSSPK